jgi:alpha-galactosidase
MIHLQVVDYLFHSLSAILGTANVEYVKWDMNRPLTEVYSAAPGRLKPTKTH